MRFSEPSLPRNVSNGRWREDAFWFSDRRMTPIIRLFLVQITGQRPGKQKRLDRVQRLHVPIKTLDDQFEWQRNCAGPACSLSKSLSRELHYRNRCPDRRLSRDISIILRNAYSVNIFYTGNTLFAYISFRSCVSPPA